MIVVEDCTRGMKKQVGKSKLFTKATLTEMQDKMCNACIKSYNKFYEVNTRLKEKQKGRNQDINVNEMVNYIEIKKQLKQKEQKLEKANTQTKELDNTSKDIDKILGSLKTTKLNKNNMVISNEDVQKIKNYTEDVKELHKFKGFWHSLMKHFQNKIGFDKDEHYKYVSDDLYKNGIFDDNDNEIANNVRRKVK